MMNTCDIREYFDNIFLGNPEEIIDNLSIIEDHFFYVINFTNENKTFESDLEGSAELRLGTEWRVGAISLRGGYHYEKNPYKYAYKSDDIEGFSVGAGFKFRGGKIDFAYQKSNNTAAYSFYNNSTVDAAELDIDTSKITATLVLNL